MNEQPSKHDFKLSEVIIIIVITCTFSIFAGISYGKIKYSEVVSINSLASEEKNNNLNEFIKQYKYIINNYYDKKSLNEEELLDTALASIVEKIGIEDPYSLYMNEDDYSEFNITLNGEYEGLGIGATKTSSSDYMSISYILKNSPASKVDLKENDIILSIDGKSTKDMDAQAFSNYVLNSEEKTFLLKIKRDKKEFNINISKGKVELESVVSETYESDGHKIGYIGVSIFASNTYTQFKKILNKLEKEKIEALIIDVRDNAGGHLKEANKISSLFIAKNKVIYQLQKGNDKPIKYYSSGKINKTYPITFITNKNTASAAEVFVLSLKENLNASVVGTKTYGKGTVQEMVELSNGDKYKITTKKWLSPKGNWVNTTDGIKPDVEVDLSDKYLNDPIVNNDNQLQEAISLLKNKLKQ